MSGGAASPSYLSGSSSASSDGSHGSSALVSVDFGRRAISVDAPEGGGPPRAVVGTWPADDGRAAREGSAVPMDAATMDPLDAAATLAGGAAAASSVASGDREILDEPVPIDDDAALSVEHALRGILENAESQEEAEACVDELNAALAAAWSEPPTEAPEPPSKRARGGATTDEGGAAEEPFAGPPAAVEPPRGGAHRNDAELNEHGYIVVPTSLTDETKRGILLSRLDDEVLTEWTQREFKLDAFEGTENPMTDGTTRLVGGGFAALGNPSSFHSPIVRELRRIAHCAMVDADPFPLEGGAMVSQVIDRLMKRLPNDAPSAESWHRDVAANTGGGLKGMYGGWINLDDTSQFFSCIRGTHNDAEDTGRGFVTTLSDKDKATIASHKARVKREGRKPVEIPSGHMLIFNERLIHEVVKTKTERTMLRLFTGWYVSTDGQPHDSRPFGSRPPDPVTPAGTAKEKLFNRLKRNACMFLKSGQAPAMAPQLHWTNFPHKIDGYAKHLRDAATCIRVRKVSTANPNPDPSSYRCPHRYEGGVTKTEIWTTLDSLEAMKRKDWTIQLWEAYSPEDIDLLLPMDREDASKAAGKIKGGSG
jgi:hypothetical protein